MKSILIAFALFVSIQSIGQDIADKISNKANYVFTINGEATLQQVSANDISSSQVFQETISELMRGHGKVHSLDQLGIDYGQRIFFVGEYTEEASLNYMAYHIKDLAQFETLVKGSRYEPKFEEKDGLKILTYDYDSKLIWNDDLAILISGYYVGEEYGEKGWYDYGYDDHYYEESTAVEEALEAIPAIEDMTEAEWRKYMEQQDLKREEERKKREEEKLKKEQEREEKRLKREESISKSLETRAKQFFSDEIKNNNEAIGLELNDDANATFWYANYISFMDPIMYGSYYPSYGRSPFGFGGLFGMTNLFSGSMIIDLFLEEEQIRIDGKMNYYGEIQEAYSKIFSQKINASFPKMISDKDLGYISMSASTEEFLNEYPNIIENMLNVYDTAYTDEYSLFADLFTVAVDEDAIAELITGDALFIFHDMGMKSVEYYSYDYDENYNYTKTLKTKTELVPDLSLVIGTNRQDIMNRFVKIGLKYELLEKIDGGYLFTESNREFPFNVYASVQDNFVIFSNSKSDLKAIVDGSLDAGIGGNKKKDVTKNSTAAYFNIKEFVTELLLTDEIRGRDKEMFNIIKDDLTDVRGTMTYDKGGSVFEATAPVPADHENASLYLLHTIDKIINQQKNRH
ncbi:MAG: hypothetical protein ACI857_001939 [Arenicella sp.]|jgi:hypothetical protein